MKRRQNRLRIPSVLKETDGNKRLLADSEAWSQRLLPGGGGDNARLDNRINKAPLAVIAVIGTLLLATLLLQLMQLQLVEGERYRGIADGNRVREKVEFAPRGRILDRNGEVLAENTASFQLSVTPYQLPEEESRRQRIYAELAEHTDETASKLQQEAEREGLDHTQPLLVLEGLDRETALELEVVLPELQGFSLDAVPMRRYKTEAGLAHILGYVGRVSSDELEERQHLHPLDFTGKMGIEAQYDDILRGQNGVTEVEVDAQQRPLRTLRNISTQPGQDIRLSIDYGLQKKLGQALKEQMEEAGVEAASGVITDPETGEVLAMVSLPSYDNNLFAKGISNQRYEQLVNGRLQPMLNRAVSDGFATGSTIKPFTLMGALGTDTVNEDTIIHDRGEITVYSQYDPSAGFTFRGWDPDGLGPMDARRAIAMSSNIYFYTVAGGHQDIEGMGIDSLTKYYRKFGLGEATGIDLPNEIDGRVPTPEWKQETKGESWFVGDTYNLAIGQGDLLVSPLQLARAYGAIINGGELIRPHLYLDADTEVQSKLDIPKKDLRIAQEGMRMVVSGNGTTAPSTFADVGVPVAGKSGTAETDPGSRQAHAWYAAYAPYENPELVSTVILEEGEGGSQYAAPAIAEAFEWYFDNR